MAEIAALPEEQLKSPHASHSSLRGGKTCLDTSGSSLPCIGLQVTIIDHQDGDGDAIDSNDGEYRTHITHMPGAFSGMPCKALGK